MIFFKKKEYKKNESIALKFQKIMIQTENAFVNIFFFKKKLIFLKKNFFVYILYIYNFFFEKKWINFLEIIYKKNPILYILKYYKTKTIQTI